MFPAVPSTTVPPGLSCPRDSASWTTYNAARSLTLPPGFWNSAFPRISQPVSRERVLRRIKGVLPIAETRPLEAIPWAEEMEWDLGWRDSMDLAEIVEAERVVVAVAEGERERGRERRAERAMRDILPSFDEAVSIQCNLK